MTEVVGAIMEVERARGWGFKGDASQVEPLAPFRLKQSIMQCNDRLFGRGFETL